MGSDNNSGLVKREVNADRKVIGRRPLIDIFLIKAWVMLQFSASVC